MEFFLGIDLTALIKTIGLAGVFFIVFAESGLLIGFFLPGDSLLFTAGFLASQGFLSIYWLVLLTLWGAVLGDSFGYWLGSKIGPAVFVREDSLFFHKKHLNRAAIFYEHYGPLTIFLARFIPFIRTFAPILAGVGKMRYRIFLSYNILGGLIWGVGMPLLGFFLGSVIPAINRYIVPVVIFIIILSLLPPVVHILRHKDEREHLLKFFKFKNKIFKFKNKKGMSE